MLHRLHSLDHGHHLNQSAPLAPAFIAKSIYRFSTTTLLREALQARPALHNLCLWDILSKVHTESTISRAFMELTTGALTYVVCAAMISEYVKPWLIDYLIHDSAAIGAHKRIIIHTCHGLAVLIGSAAQMRSDPK